jgi:uncharacterized protein YjbI with pentapeptide repeats
MRSTALPASRYLRAGQGMSDLYDKQYREQLERAETSRATMKAWFDVWVGKPLAALAPERVRKFDWPGKGWWLAGGVLLLAFIGSIGLPVLLHVYGGVYGRLAEPGSEAFGRLGIQVAGIIGGVVGLVFLGWRTWLNQRQTHIANETLYTSLLTKAVEQLGATREEKKTRKTKDESGKEPIETITETIPNTEVRIGAIYALEKISCDYEPLHWQIMEILCTYVRRNAPAERKVDASRTKIEPATSSDEEDFDTSSSDEKQPSIPYPDVQAALTVIGRRPKTRRQWEDERRKKDSHAWRLDLRGCDLTGANMEGLCFNGARFDQCVLDYASFNSAQLNDAHFGKIRAQKAKFSRAPLEGADLHCVNALDADFSFANLRSANLEESHFENSIFKESDLSGARMRQAQLQAANLMDCNVRGASLDSASLAAAKLNRVRLDRAILNLVDFENAVLTLVSLDGAQLSGATFGGSKLRNCWLGQVDMQNVIELQQDQLHSIWGTDQSFLPEDCAKIENEKWSWGTPSETSEEAAERRRQHRSQWERVRESSVS